MSSEKKELDQDTRSLDMILDGLDTSGPSSCYYLLPINNLLSSSSSIIINKK